MTSRGHSRVAKYKFKVQSRQTKIRNTGCSNLMTVIIELFLPSFVSNTLKVKKPVVDRIIVPLQNWRNRKINNDIIDQLDELRHYNRTYELHFYN